MVPGTVLDKARVTLELFSVIISAGTSPCCRVNVITKFAPSASQIGPALFETVTATSSIVDKDLSTVIKVDPVEEYAIALVACPRKLNLLKYLT